MGPSTAREAKEGGPGGDKLTLRNIHANIHGALSQERGLERACFEGAEAKKASVLTDKAPVVRGHFNYLGRRPLLGREGHPGFQQGQDIAGKELQGERTQHGTQRWPRSVSVRA